LKEEFPLWYMMQNPSRVGVTAMVEIISLWNFLLLHQDSDVNQWITEQWCAKKIGFKHTVNANTSTHFCSLPSSVCQHQTDPFLSTMIIDMLKSLTAFWLRNGIGDGNKENSAQIWMAIKWLAFLLQRKSPQSTPQGVCYQKWRTNSVFLADAFSLH
jgi:hypothetical protein